MGNSFILKNIILYLFIIIKNTTMKLTLATLLLTILGCFSSLNAQNTIVNSEIGVSLGPTYFQGDFGEADNFKSSTANVGIGFDISYIMDFSDSRYRSPFLTKLADHVKQRLQISYSKIQLEHDPIPVSSTSTQYLNFAAMQGETKILSFSTSSEIYIFSIIKKQYKLEPYFTLGIGYNIASPSISSSLAIPTVYTTGYQKIFIDKQIALSFIYGAGTRYRLKDVDLLFEANMQSFVSDKIDGLDPNVTGDKNNDSTVSFRIGAVFHLDSRR